MLTFTNALSTFAALNAQQRLGRVFEALLIGYILFFFVTFFISQQRKKGDIAWIQARRKKPLVFERGGKFTKWDWIPLLLLTAIYTVVTFATLGDNVAPATYHRYNQQNPTVKVTFDKPLELSKTEYFTWLYRGNNHDNKEGDPCCYTLAVSQDGVNFQDPTSGKEMHQSHAETFRWKFVDVSAPFLVKAVEVTYHNGETPLEMAELAFFEKIGEDNRVWINPNRMTVEPAEAKAQLFDEQTLVPEYQTVANSTHFDEIYHAYTAYEFIRGVYPYEITHPPLGKEITMVGIKIFGMNPFGWRFFPALFGALMVPIFYYFVKVLTGKMSVAVAGTIVWAFDFMHFVQTRISTIDVYGVFFILLMYLFMYLYMTAPKGKLVWRAVVPFALCGLSFGLGAASKWIDIYAGAGLLILLLCDLYSRYRACDRQAANAAKEHKKELNDYQRALAGQRRKYAKGEDVPAAEVLVKPVFQKPASFGKELCKIVALGLVFFVAIPLTIYTASYIPYSLSDKNKPAENGLIKETIRQMKNNQKYMMDYHSKLESTHPYSASWPQWVFDSKSLLYYIQTNDIKDADGNVVKNADGTNKQEHASLVCFGGPLQVWAGFICFFTLFWLVFRRHSFTPMFIIVAILSQFMPWLLVPRLTFPYHYFPTLMFLCLGLCYLFNRFIEGHKANASAVKPKSAAPAAMVLEAPSQTKFTLPKPNFGHWMVFSFALVSVLLFVLFYPVLTGEFYPSKYFDLLRWIPSLWSGKIGWTM